MPIHFRRRLLVTENFRNFLPIITSPIDDDNDSILAPTAHEVWKEEHPSTGFIANRLIDLRLVMPSYSTVSLQGCIKGCTKIFSPLQWLFWACKLLIVVNRAQSWELASRILVVGSQSPSKRERGSEEGGSALACNNYVSPHIPHVQDKSRNSIKGPQR